MPSTPARTCACAGCERRHYAHGYCQGHYRQHIDGRELRPLEPRVKRGPRRTKPYTGRTIDARGYVRLYRPDHPNRQASGWVFEHVFVMSDSLGRALLPDERVHHRNGVRDDNRPENLELWSTLPQPSGQRTRDLVDWAIEILQRYAPGVLR
jgi:hypothetical protein